MKFLIWLILFLINCQAEVIKLTDSNKRQVLSASKNTLILFQKPNCKYCELLDPIYSQLGELYDNDEEFQLAKTNAAENRILKSNFKPTRYPSVFLYNNVAKTIQPFKGNRNLIDLVNFINENTDTINKELESNIFEIRKIEEFNQRRKKGNLIVFALSYLPIWQDYQYPTHFYQQLSYQHNIKFSILFIDLIDSTKFLDEYKISNYPSAIFFKSPTKFKTFKTFSKDHLQGNKLDEQSLTDFTYNLHSEDHGHWFDGTDELNEYLQNEKYQYERVGHYGLNIRQNEVIVDESSYEEMLDKMDF
ncbi:hypothetical protein CLIB1444_20S00804 [[Candida] jaroonii]|uniref:Uncharacterized protein n=1 Tax=[Candida] jaroonii TaxID=467808 RepID=A0ACA9YGJ2_9ASCO|nr:hypothetical protein CLIB1444_20S00804 [[Candida] jaroonii]